MEKVLVYDMEDMEFNSDIALLVFHSDKEMPVASLNPRAKLYIGNEIFHIGCGLGDQFRLDYGKVTSVKNSKANPEVFGRIKVSALTIVGDSGGPLFHENKVIGITESIRQKRDHPFYITAYNNISFAIPIENFTEHPEIKKHLKLE